MSLFSDSRDTPTWNSSSYRACSAGTVQGLHEPERSRCVFWCLLLVHSRTDCEGFIDAKPWIRNGFLDRCTEKQRSARYVDLNRRAPGECQRCSVSNPISEASRASDLGDDQGSDLRRICLTRLFATLTRFDRATDVSRRKGTDLGGFGKNGK